MTVAAVFTPPPRAAVMATVTEVSGRAWVRQPDGSLLELQPGSTVAPGSEIVTDSGASVTLAIDGAAPITIGESRSVALTDDLITPAEPGEAAIALPASTDSERLLAALEAGDDPFGILEATAAIAGGPGGDDGGSSFVRLLRISESTTPYAAGQAAPRAARANEDLLRLNGEAEGSAAAASTLPPPGGGTPPVFARLSVLEDHTLTGNTLNGATNAQGDPLSIAQFVVNGQTYNAGATATITDASRPAKWQTVGTIKLDANGDYTFIPSADWNGTVPDVSVIMTDGAVLSTDKLEIDVIAVNDQPTSVHAAYSASGAAGEDYVFRPQDFPLRDDKDSDVNGVLVAPTEVVIESLPPYGGTLLLDGNPVTVGTRVSLADLQAGKLVYHVDADYKGSSLLPFYFRVDDGGGTDNGGVAESNPYSFRLNVGKLFVGNNASSGGEKWDGEGIYGGFGKDILIGDEGGVEHRQVDANADLNIALVLDFNAFTSEKFHRSDSPLTKAEALKDALASLLNNQLLTHAGKVNVALITFDGAASTEQLWVADLNAGDVATILTFIDSLVGAINSQADYTEAFRTAKAWFDKMAASYTGYENKTFFLTDSDANGNAEDMFDAFNQLKQVSEVRAIATGQYDQLHSWTNNDRIAQYDTVDTRMVADVSRYTVHADFQDSTGANDVNAWEVSSNGQGSMEIVNGVMLIRSESTANYVLEQSKSTVVTQKEANKMVVTDPDGAYFSFRVDGWNEPYTDTFSWRLLKWDATALGGQGDWVVAETGGSAIGVFLSTNETIMTSHQPPGDYRFEFEAHSSSLWSFPGSIKIDDIRIHKPVLEGSPQYVHGPDELTASLSINGTVIKTVGDDWFETSIAGHSIVFGDALNADGLPWGQGGNPAKPTDKHGLDALKFFLQETLGHAPTHAEIYDYIWTNHRLFNVASDTHGGNDFIQLGQWASLAYGGGGDDTIYGGIGAVGGSNILYGGAGNDYLSSGSGGGSAVLVGGQDNDTLQVDSLSGNTDLVWLAGDAGTVALPAVDKVTGFSLDRNNLYGSHFRDRLDLRDLLVGEENSADLTDYLNISKVVENGQDWTIINVSTTGDLQTSGFDQQIRMQNIDLIDLHGGLTDQQQIINALIQAGTLLVDQ